MRLRWMALGVLLGTAAVAAASLTSDAAGRRSERIRAAYFYHYMDFDHLDRLARHGFNRAIIHMIGDSLSVEHGEQLSNWVERGEENHVEVVPKWNLQAVDRLRALPDTRRYTWGRGDTHEDIACPLHEEFWRSTLLDRAGEVLAAAPGIKRVTVDLELYDGPLTHYIAGPCRCRECLAEYTGMPLGWYKAANAWRLSGLMSYEESRLTDIFYRILSDFAVQHPGIELGVLDLDKDSFVHRALGRALALTDVPTVDYSEKSYAVGGTPMRGARARLDELGLADAPLVGGLWLKQFAPDDVPGALRSINDRADGYFIFTTYSLWHDVSELEGPYTLLGRQADYWTALNQVNRSP